MSGYLWNILYVGLGSCLGGIVRYLLSDNIKALFPGIFPIATFVVNILGCLAIGFIYGLSLKCTAISPALKLFLTVGFCGGFTTFSTFMNENYQLFDSNNIMYMALYTGASVAVGFVMVFVGYWLARFV